MNVRAITAAVLIGSIAVAISQATPPRAVRAAGGDAVDVYGHIGPADIDPELAGLAPMVYVPNEHGRSVTVIDATTFEVVKTIRVGDEPHHVTPTWGMRRLLVNDMESDRLTVIDPFTMQKVRRIPVQQPYNLYFTPDGRKALVINEAFDRIDFFEMPGWRPLRRLAIPSRGVDHGDFSANGRFMIVSSEFDGWIHRINVERMRVADSVDLGGRPIDVKVSADGSVFYIANQQRDGVTVLDPTTMTEIDFLPTGQGAHGFVVRRDGDGLFVANRRAGTISVLDFATRSIVDTWDIGGSPDMMNVSTDGSHLWVSYRWHDKVAVIDTATGEVIKRIDTGVAPHGLTYWPQPGRFSIGHNGVYR